MARILVKLAQSTQWSVIVCVYKRQVFDIQQRDNIFAIPIENWYPGKSYKSEMNFRLSWKKRIFDKLPEFIISEIVSKSRMESNGNMYAS